VVWARVTGGAIDARREPDALPADNIEHTDAADGSDHGPNRTAFGETSRSVHGPVTGASDGGRDGTDAGHGDGPDSSPNRTARVPARAEVRRLLRRHGTGLTAQRISERTGVSIHHARKLLREERHLHLVDQHGADRGAER